METDNTQPLLTIAEAQALSDDDLLQVLKAHWQIESDELLVWGELIEINTAEDTFIKLTNVKAVNQTQLLTYPVDLPTQHDIPRRGIFLNSKVAREFYTEKGVRWITCAVELSEAKEREKHNNPFILKVQPSSIKPLIELSELKDEQHQWGYITEGIIEHVSNINKDLLDQKNASLIEDVNIKEQQIKAIESGIASVQQQKDSATEQLIKAQKALESVKGKEIEMKQSLSELTRYIEQKTRVLEQLDLIDKVDESSKVEEEDEGEHLNFSSDFNSDYSLVSQYIQANLAENGFLYPKEIVDNFITLLRCNDLIVLAGDSGAGKTSLVKAFAKAIGGVAKIIPVKPNWTGSEDLVGYYNPIEKKYISTPFLDALIEARDNPTKPYLICLDEMNLAKVEYYFADFLSKMEERNGAPKISLYSDDSVGHTLSEIKTVLTILQDARSNSQNGESMSFVELIQDEAINKKLRLAFGMSDQESLVKYHGDIRRLIAERTNKPSVLTLPENVRIVGSVNIDDTTHFLSPKILDRVHVMQFQSPLLMDLAGIKAEVELNKEKGLYELGVSRFDLPVMFSSAEMGRRHEYPAFDASSPFCELMTKYVKEFFHPLGLDFGMRPVRQGLNYQHYFNDVNTSEQEALNNFFLFKVLPKLNFDGTVKVGEYHKHELLLQMHGELKQDIGDDIKINESFSSVKLLGALLKKAEANGWNVNFWL